MAIQKFDQLNSMSSKWFSKMNVSEAEQKKRVKLSLDYCEIIILLLMMIEGSKSIEKSKAFAEERLKAVAEKYVGKNNIAYINDWSKKEAEKIVDVTFKHIDEEHGPDDFYEMPELGIRLPESEYWTSEERGLLIGIECATTTANFDDMSKAVDKGKTRKTWITEADDRVRKTHDEVHGVEMPINQPFLVGNSYLLFPGDLTYDPEEKEVANCRCHAEYF